MDLPPAPDIARRLLAFPTVNPPGDETEAQSYLRSLLEGGGLGVESYERVAGRPNLVARLPGSGTGPALILHGHVDVVGVADQEWDRPPFAAVVEDGILHGRGALDDKGGVAMLTHAFVRAAADDVTPSGDVVLALVADSETGGGSGLGFLLDEHPEVFEGARYAIGEFGGFPLHAFGRRYYRIGVALKQYAHLRLGLTGRGGHGSRPSSGTVIGRLGEVLARLDHGSLPHHRSRVAEQVIDAVAAGLSDPEATSLRRLLDPGSFDQALADLGEHRDAFESMFRDTANATIVRAGSKFNVVPSRADIEVDLRVLPGRDVAAAVDDLRELTGARDLDVEVVATGPPAPDRFDPGLFGTLSEILVGLDPEAIPIPYLFGESPDGRLFDAHGIQHYGFLPMNLPPALDLPHLIHGPNERVPLQAVSFGAEALYRLVTGY